MSSRLQDAPHQFHACRRGLTVDARPRLPSKDATQIQTTVDAATRGVQEGHHRLGSSFRLIVEDTFDICHSLLARGPSFRSRKKS